MECTYNVDKSKHRESEWDSPYNSNSDIDNSLLHRLTTTSTPATNAALCQNWRDIYSKEIRTRYERNTSDRHSNTMTAEYVEAVAAQQLAVYQRSGGRTQFITPYMIMSLAFVSHNTNAESSRQNKRKSETQSTHAQHTCLESEIHSSPSESRIIREETTINVKSDDVSNEKPRDRKSSCFTTDLKTEEKSRHIENNKETTRTNSQMTLRPNIRGRQSKTMKTNNENKCRNFNRRERNKKLNGNKCIPVH